MTKELSTDGGYDYTLGACYDDELTIDGITSSRIWDEHGYLNTRTDRPLFELIDPTDPRCTSRDNHYRCLRDAYHWTPGGTIWP